MATIIARRPAYEFNRSVNTVYMYLLGTPEAFVIAKIQAWIKVSNNKRDGRLWVYKTFDEWAEELPFWSKRTLKRAFKKLEKMGVVISTDKYNKMKIDRTKWYRINDTKLNELCSTTEVQELVEKITAPERNYKNYMTVEQRETMKFVKDDAKESNEPAKKTEKHKEGNQVKAKKSKEVTEVIDYLNEKTGARYKPSSQANRNLVLARMNEGYTVQDLKTVIDNQVSAWRGTEWEKYLRPSTLFRASKIENYLNSKRLNHSSRYNSTVQDQYDNLQYTDLSKEDLSGGPF